MSPSRALRADVVIVGAGLAGAATAFHLVQEGVRDVLLLEREAAPGAHASGKNAGLVRRLVEEPMLGAVLQGAAILAAPPEGVSRTPLVRACGSVVIVPESEAVAWTARAAAAAGAGVRALARGALERLIPEIAPSAGGIAYHSPEDGTVEPREVLLAWLSAAERGGARVLTGIGARSLALEGGRVVGVETDRGRVEAACVVDASGPWAGALARAAGARAPRLTPHRRHIHTARGPAWDAAVVARPYLWDVAGGYYVRAAPGADDGSTRLLSPCDEDPIAAPTSPADLLEAGSAVRPERALELREKLRARAPSLASLEIAASRACLRTFAPDGRFVIGPDPALPGLVYVAGLGGHGVTTSGVVGILGAQAVLRPEEVPEEMRPGRPLST